MNKTIIVILSTLGAVFLLIVLSCAGLFWYGYSKAQNMVEKNMVIAIPAFDAAKIPTAVPDSIPSLVARINEAKKSSVRGTDPLAHGLSEAELQALEKQYGIVFNQELRSFYENCDGSRGGYFTDHQIMSPLAEALQQRQVFKDGAADTSFLKALRPQAELLMLFTDASGETIYYWDPRKVGTFGAFFSRNGMTGVYRVYPSLGNMLIAMTECQESGAYAGLSLKNPVLGPDAVAKEEAIHEKYALKIQGPALDLDP